MQLLVISLVLVPALALRSGGLAPWRPLCDNTSVPTFGVGTWLGWASKDVPYKPQGHEVEDAVSWAIDAGYRHIDTASVYYTESQVGRAIKKKIADGTVKREDLFITTKLWSDRHARDAVVPALRESLQRLELDYVDLYLIHFPIALDANDKCDDSVDYLDTWRGMIAARDQGLTKSIGVSNFNQQQLERIIAMSPIKPVMLQIELNLNIQQPALLAYCRSQGIEVTSYMPISSLFPRTAAPDAPPPRVNDPVLVAIAEKYNKTVLQVVLRYLWELGAIPIPKSTNRAHLQENIQVFDFSLAAEDKLKLSSFERGYRFYDFHELHCNDSKYYPFENEKNGGIDAY